MIHDFRIELIHKTMCKDNIKCKKIAKSANKRQTYNFWYAIENNESLLLDDKLKEIKITNTKLE